MKEHPAHSPGRLQTALAENAAAVNRIMNESIDLVERRFSIGGRLNAALFYMSGMLSVEQLQDNVMRPLLNEMQSSALAQLLDAIQRENAPAHGTKGGTDSPPAAAKADKKGRNRARAHTENIYPPAAEAQRQEGENSPVVEALLQYSLPVAELTTETELEALANSLIYGDAVLLLEGEAQAVVLSFKKWDKRGISEPPTSAVIRGPREGFIEDMKTNTGLIRRRLRTPDLIYDQFQVGRYTKTNITVAYVKGIASEELVEKIVTRIKSIDIDGVIDSFYIQQFLEEKKNGLFKQVGYTEKPDICVGRMLEGKIAVVVDGSPIVLTLPYLLYEDLQSSSDYYMPQPVSVMVRLLRIFAVMISFLLPGLYVSMLVFHYNMLPPKMVITLSNAVQATPFSPLAEMLLVFLLFVVIYESSLRMPRYVGMALSLVGAIVLGDTAVKAGLISSTTVLIAAISMLAAHTIPDDVMSISILVIGFILLGGFLGILGLLLGLLVLAVYLAGLDSYGTPYLAPFAPHVKKDMKDGVFMQDIAHRRTRPFSIPSENKTRLRDQAPEGAEGGANA